MYLFLNGVNMVYDVNALLNNINRIRKEIDHEEVSIDIKEILYDKDTNEMWIITNDRPDKSAIIGKGGWVVGRLREELEIASIHVESYSDFLQKEYRMELSLNKLNSFVNENKDNLDYGAFIALEEYIEGKTLADMLEENLIPEERAVAITRSICKVLDNLHTLDHRCRY